MKNVDEVLKLKEREISRLEIEVEALRIAAPLLAEEGETGNHSRVSAARLDAPSEITLVSSPANVNPQLSSAAEWKDKAQGMIVAANSLLH
jgi:hypothetical protein